MSEMEWIRAAMGSLQQKIEDKGKRDMIVYGVEDNANTKDSC